MVSYDEKYPEYLSSMGLPGFVVSLVLSSSETVKIKQPDQPGGNWSMITVTGTFYPRLLCLLPISHTFWLASLIEIYLLTNENKLRVAVSVS